MQKEHSEAGAPVAHSVEHAAAQEGPTRLAHFSGLTHLQVIGPEKYVPGGQAWGLHMPPHSVGSVVSLAASPLGSGTAEDASMMVGGSSAVVSLAQGAAQDAAATEMAVAKQKMILDRMVADLQRREAQPRRVWAEPRGGERYPPAWPVMDPSQARSSLPYC